MCFSASASFSAGIILSGIGVASLKKVKQPSEIPFASIPLIFAVQQFCEGMLWLSLTNPDYAHFQSAGTYLFLFFAQIVWPVWVPLSILLLAKKENRKRIAKIVVVIGAIVSAYLAFCLFNYNVTAKIIGSHISYKQDYPNALARYGGVLYVIATIVPAFLSRVKLMWTIGAAILVSYIITEIFYANYIVSVWCFFAAVISVAVLGVIHVNNKTPATG